MQYLEDIIELVEDLPEEIGKRFDQIRKWDTDVERLRLECKYAAKRIMEVQNSSSPMRDKILNELADKYRLIHRLSEKKLDLAIRSERLMTAVLEKAGYHSPQQSYVADSSYLCKIELEVDNPGCTEAIERNFCRLLGLRPTSSHLTSCNMEFEPMDEARSSGQDQDQTVNGKPSISDGRELGVSNIANGSRERESCSPRSFTCDSPQPSCSGPKPKKRKYNADTPSPPIPNFARRKQEKERERSRLSRVNAARNDESRRKLIKIEEPDPSYEQALKPVSGGTEGVDMSNDGKWGSPDPLGSEDDFDASDVMGLFPSLPSPPREIMESLKEDSLFPDDDFMGYETHPTGFPHSPAMQGIVLDSVTSSPSPSTSTSSWDRKKKSGISFGNVNETTSLHGRPRKMTERAVELLQNHKDREKLKRSGGTKAESVDGEGNERWCFCREVSSGNMICCDDPECKYQCKSSLKIYGVLRQQQL
ncbi:hypothetical protein Q1695_011181 [Nippostrongylus brasiliensis]|nr:hypothetical protein Q1695_011181 [Nippostrongylus brasiliensis]